MGKAMYLGVSSKARKGKKAYLGVSGKARKIKKMYIGVDGKARLFWSGGGDKLFLAYITNNNTSMRYFSEFTVESFKEGDVLNRDSTTVTRPSYVITPSFSYCVDGVYYVFVSSTSPYVIGVYYSSDLTSWTFSAFPTELNNSASGARRQCMGVYYANGRFLAFVTGNEKLNASSSTYYNSLYCYESLDAKAWTQRGNVLYKQTASQALYQTRFEYGNVGGSPAYFIIVTKGSYHIDYYSRDLNTWTELTYLGDTTCFSTCVDDAGDVFHMYSINGTGSYNLWIRNLNTGTKKSYYYTNGNDSQEFSLVAIDDDHLGYITVHLNTTGYKILKAGKPDATISTTQTGSGAGYPIRDRDARDTLVTKHGNKFYWVRGTVCSQTEQGSYMASNLSISTSEDFINWTDNVISSRLIRAVTSLSFEKNL